MALDANGGSGHCLGAPGGLGDSGGDDSTRRRFAGALDRSLRVGLLRTDGDLGLLWGVSSDLDSDEAPQSGANCVMTTPGGGSLS
jgi:hypothetical protein